VAVRWLDIIVAICVVVAIVATVGGVRVKIYVMSELPRIGLVGSIVLKYQIKNIMEALRLSYKFL
jgi:hypothetical protein